MSVWVPVLFAAGVVFGYAVGHRIGFIDGWRLAKRPKFFLNCPDTNCPVDPDERGDVRELEYIVKRFGSKI